MNNDDDFLQKVIALIASIVCLVINIVNRYEEKGEEEN